MTSIQAKKTFCLLVLKKRDRFFTVVCKMKKVSIILSFLMPFFANFKYNPADKRQSLGIFLDAGHVNAGLSDVFLIERCRLFGLCVSLGGLDPIYNVFL